MIRLFLVSSLMLFLAACGPKWTNPDLDPDKQKAALAHDRGVCQDLVDQTYPVLSPAERHPDLMGPVDTEQQEFADTPFMYERQLDDYESDYEEDTAKQKLFNKCMRNHGWVKK